MCDVSPSKGIRKRRAPTLASVTKDEYESMTKKQRRALRNRESAFRSRQRKRAEMEELRQRVARLQSENERLRKKLAEKGSSIDIFSEKMKTRKEDRQSTEGLVKIDATKKVSKRSRSRNEFARPTTVMRLTSADLWRDSLFENKTTSQSRQDDTKCHGVDFTGTLRQSRFRRF